MVYCFAVGSTPPTQLRRLLCSLSRDNSEQLTVFQCDVQSAGVDALLVLPSLPGTRLIDLSQYSEIFRDLTRLTFPGAPAAATATEGKPRVPAYVEVWKDARIPEGIVSPEDASKLSELYPPGGGDYDLVAMRVESGGLSFPLAYAHPARPDLRLFVPTRVGGDCDDTKWDNLIFTVNTTHSAGLSAVSTNLNAGIYRDLISGFVLPEIRDIRKILTNVVQPNTNLYLATTGTDQNAIPFVGPDGTEFIDRTNLHVVRFQTYGFNTIPIVNGCFLTAAADATAAERRSPYHFGGGGTCVFDEETERICLTDDVGTDLETSYHVYPSRVIRQDDQYFLEYEAATSPGPQ